VVTTEVSTAGRAVPGQGAEEWRRHWPLILTTLVGSTFTGQHVYSTGVIMKPLNEAFGWSRGEISLTVTMAGLATVFFAPVVGMLTQRYGPRRVALIAVPLTALCFSSIALTGPALWTYYAAFVIYSIIQVAIGPVLWASAVTSTFKATRGLALGIGLSGTGFSSIIYPQAALWLTERFGWQGVFWGLALTAFTLLMPLVLFSFRPLHAGESGATTASAPEVSGRTFRETIRTGLYWRIVLVLTTAAATISTIKVHLVPLLTDKGVSAPVAASIIGVLGISTLAGRWIGGFLLDRLPARLVAIPFFILPAGGCLLFANFSGSVEHAVLAAALIGVSYGVEGDMLPFLVSRYFGQRAYSKVFGVSMSFFGLGYALAPPAAGFLFDRIGSYAAFLTVLSGLLIIAALVAMTFGKYPELGSEGARPARHC
jgi:predicted MFS family arabinose efflux permease